MSKYQIIRWNVVTDCNGIQRPMIYFKPDLSIIYRFKNNDNYLYLDIDQCGLYSGNMIPALIDIASQQPNYRPNFLRRVIYCATLLETPWYGFPNLNQSGQFSVYTGVIIPTCWRANGNCLVRYHIRHITHRMIRQDILVMIHQDILVMIHQDILVMIHQDILVMNVRVRTSSLENVNADISKNSKLDCILGGTTVSDANACKASKDGDAVYFKDGITVDGEENCYTCNTVPSIISGEDYKCKWNPVEDFEQPDLHNKNKISTVTPQQPLEKTSPGCSKNPSILFLAFLKILKL